MKVMRSRWHFLVINVGCCSHGDVIWNLAEREPWEMRFHNQPSPDMFQLVSLLLKKKFSLFDLYLHLPDSNNRPPLSIPTIKQTTCVDFQFCRNTRRLVPHFFTPPLSWIFYLVGVFRKYIVSLLTKWISFLGGEKSIKGEYRSSFCNKRMQIVNNATRKDLKQ